MYDDYGLDFILRGGAEPQPAAAGGAGPSGMPFGAGGGMPGGFAGMGGMPGGGRTFHFSTATGGGGFHFSNPESIFSEFLRHGGAGMGDEDDLFASFAGGGRQNGGGRTSRDPSGSGQKARRAPTPEVTTVERSLPVTLEEMYKGTHKKMKIKRKTFDADTNKRKMEEKFLEMDIKPGYKAGTKIKFKGVGDQEEGGTQDMHFILTEVSPFESLCAKSKCEDR